MDLLKSSAFLEDNPPKYHIKFEHTKYTMFSRSFV